MVLCFLPCFSSTFIGHCMADLQYASCIDAKWHIRKPQPMPKGMLQSMSMACASNGLLQPLECLDLCTAAKTARWSTLYYGQLPYLVTFAAAKTHIQFYIIERGNVTPKGCRAKDHARNCVRACQIALSSCEPSQDAASSGELPIPRGFASRSAASQPQ